MTPATLSTPTHDRARTSSIQELGSIAAAAHGVAEHICSMAVPCGDGMVTWLEEMPQSGTKPKVLGPHLYDGTLGISLFLAAAASLESDAPQAQAWRETALAGSRPMRRKLGALVGDPERAAAFDLGVGGLTGVAAFVYALTRIGDFSAEPEAVREAIVIADAFLTEDKIHADRRLDLMSGTAGALCALLTLRSVAVRHGLVDDERAGALLASATLCGRHLLATQETAGGWPGLDRPALTGFAHGAAGIAHALLRLAEDTGEAVYRDAALRSLRFERELYRPEARNWMDPRRGRPLEQTAWCHGAPGMLLSRVAAVSADAAPELQTDLELALELTLDLPEKEIDHLCCGNAGQIEILSLAAARLGRPELETHAARLAAAVIDRGTRFQVEENAVPEALDLSLFLGHAGWGWSLLQLAHGGTLPSVLWME